MIIKDLILKQPVTDNKKLEALYLQFKRLLEELNKKSLSDNTVTHINNDVMELNSSNLTDNELKRLMKKKQTNILKLAEKEAKVVPKNYYRNLWMVVGMSAFGLPIGVVFGLLLGNIGLMGIGLPIGMVIGIVVGSGLDRKAVAEGKQMDVEIKA